MKEVIRSSIFQDHEYNIWFGTNGTGVFRYSFQPFLIFDQFTATKNMNVMPMLENNKRALYRNRRWRACLYMMEKNNSRSRTVRMIRHTKYYGLYLPEGGEFIFKPAVVYLQSTRTGNFKVPLGEIKGCINSVIPDEARRILGCLLSGLFQYILCGENDRHKFIVHRILRFQKIPFWCN